MLALAHRASGKQLRLVVWAALRREGVACSEDALRAFCEEKLGRYKTPKIFRFVSELPRGPSGKVQRLKLVQFKR